MNWLYYLGEANLYLIVFYAGYRLFLSKETYHTLNRIYLLSSCACAFVLPTLQLGFLKPRELFVTVVDPNLYPDGPELWQQNLVLAYISGACLFAGLFFVKLFKLWVIIRQSYIEKMENHKTIYIDESNTAFSFFNYLFIAEETERINFIRHHELVHIRQKHSADIIFTEILKVLNWFNPVIYLVQRSLKNVHEFIADEKTAATNNDRLGYSAFLINNAYGLSGVGITHSFFNNNLLKRRILMLNSKRSGKLATLKYLVIAPLFAVMLCISTLSFSKSYGWFDVAPKQQVPPPPPAPPSKNKAPNVKINDVKPKAVKFPKPVVTSPKAKNTDRVKFPRGTVLPNPPTPKAVTKRQPPPPPPAPPAADNHVAPKNQQKLAVVKFPPPVVKPAKKKVVKFPPPVIKPDPPKMVKFPPPVVKPNNASN